MDAGIAEVRAAAADTRGVCCVRRCPAGHSPLGTRCWAGGCRCNSRWQSWGSALLWRSETSEPCGELAWGFWRKKRLLWPEEFDKWLNTDKKQAVITTIMQATVLNISRMCIKCRWLDHNQPNTPTPKVIWLLKAPHHPCSSHSDQIWGHHRREREIQGEVKARCGHQGFPTSLSPPPSFKSFSVLHYI